MFYLGTLGLVFEPMATTLEALVDPIDDDTLVALDPNCRPSTIDDPAGYRGRLERLLPRTGRRQGQRGPTSRGCTPARRLWRRPAPSSPRTAPSPW
jgi:hypothetical protein